MNRSRMTMRAKVQRNTAATKDAYGGAVPPAWQALATLPCWAWSKEKRLIADGQKGALKLDLRCAFPGGADVTEADRLEQIEDRLGTVLYPGPLAILTLQRRRGHLEAMLERVH